MDKTIKPATRPRPHFRTIAMIIGTAMFMEQLDGTVLATGLPTMARDLGVTPANMSIALTSYLVSLAIFIPASGKIADKWGARKIFGVAIGVFTLGSILCAQSQSLWFLVIARFLQGMGGAMMLPVGRLLLLRSIEKHQLMSAMSWLLIPALIGPILGPPLGGFIITYFNWRWIFYINVPIGLLGIALNRIFIPDVSGHPGTRFDIKGMVLSTIALAALLFGFELTSHPGELDTALPLLAAGVIGGALYLMHARRTSDPILDFRLLKIPSFGTSVIAGSLTRITQGAQPFLLPMMFQLNFGLTALQSGLMTLATALGAFGMKILAPHLLRRFGFRDSLTINGVAATFGYMSCALFRPDWPFPVIFAIMTLCGFLMSFQFTAYNTIAYDEIAPEQLSAATSFYTTFQQLMLSLGICAGALGLQSAMALRGDATPQLADFSAAFLLVTVISMGATIWNRRFAPNAGAVMSGHKPRDGTSKSPEAAALSDLARAAGD